MGDKNKKKSKKKSKKSDSVSTTLETKSDNMDTSNDEGFKIQPSNQKTNIDTSQ